MIRGAEEDFALRDAVPDDAQPIAAVHARSWYASYRGILTTEALSRVSREQPDERWRRILADKRNPPTTVVATDSSGAVLGFCAFSVRPPHGDEAERPAARLDADARTGALVALYVDPDHWGSGVGRSLVEEPVRRMRRESARRVAAWVLRDNLRARAFYAHLGFRPNGVEGFHEPMGAWEIRVQAELD